MTPSKAEQFQYLQWVRQLDPPYYVNSVAISGDGSLVVAGSFFHLYSPPDAPQSDASPAMPDQFGTYLFNREGVQLWADKFQGYEGVYAVAISGDGTIAASGGWFTSSPSFQGFVRAYDTANGPTPILNYNPPERTNALALSSDGTTLVAAADNVYLFQQSNGVFSDKPAVFPLNNTNSDDASGATNNAQSIAMSADGSWFVVGDLLGNVYLVENNGGAIGKHYVWNTASLKTIHSVAMTADGQWFTVGGSDGTVYLFSFESMTAATPAPTGTFPLPSGGRVGWVAISGDGSLLSAVGNEGTAGAVYALQNNNGTPKQSWTANTPHNPNSTSIDASAKYVTVADGYPDGKPGSFSLYEASNGNQLWQYPTTNMNWPMFISADGSGIAAGTDDGDVFYFTPK